MPTITISVLLAAGAGAIGVAIGWAVHALIYGNQRDRAAVQHDCVTSHEATDAQTSVQFNPIQPADEIDPGAVDLPREVLAELQEIASHMQTDVDQHTNRIQEVSDELSESQPQESIAVVQAITKLVQANEKMQSRLCDAEDRLVQQEREIETHVSAARTDALTSLANRRAFDDELASAFERFRGNSEPLCVMMLDIDHFKNFNDTHGHQAGDEVLRGVGRVLAGEVQENDIAVRYGGEEFAMIYRGARINDIQQRADQARAAIDQTTFRFEGTDLHVTASAGVAQLLTTDDVKSLIKRADGALYASKEAGRNCGHWHDGERYIPLRNEPAANEVPSTPIESSTNQDDEPIVVAEGRDRETGLPTREVFCERVETCVEAQQESGETISIVMLQVDDFQRLVDNGGEVVGKSVLKALRQFFKAVIRDVECTARFDDDVFSIMMPGAAIGEAMHIAERLQHAIARCRLPIGENHLQFTVSMGAAESALDQTTDRLLERCQEALETAVASGPNVCFFHDGHRPERAEPMPLGVS